MHCQYRLYALTCQRSITTSQTNCNSQITFSTDQFSSSFDTPVPKTPHFIKGVMNLRGNIIPVVDMRIKFDMPEIEPHMYTSIVIITIDGKNIGFIVDKVEEVVNVDDENISLPPEFGSNVDTKFIKNMAKQKNKVIMILDLVALFGEDELGVVQALSKTA